jgi:hypothetical protein
MNLVVHPHQNPRHIIFIPPFNRLARSSYILIRNTVIRITDGFSIW